MIVPFEIYTTEIKALSFIQNHKLAHLKNIFSISASK